MSEDTQETVDRPNIGEGIYLFCFAFPNLPHHLTADSLDEQYPVSHMRVNDIAAVLSKIRLKEFSGPSLESKMEDLSWMGPRIYLHQAVITEVMDYSPVFPASFGTIFSSSQRLEELMRYHHDTIARLLGEVQDKSEWAVKGFWDRDIARKNLSFQALPEAEEDLSSLSPGKQYFQKKRTVSDAEKAMNRQLKVVLEEIWYHLKQDATDCCERKVLSRDSTGKDADMVLNWAYLISREMSVDLHTRIDHLNREHEKQGLTFELTGPWPPYSFCPVLDLEEI